MSNKKAKYLILLLIVVIVLFMLNIGYVGFMIGKGEGYKEGIVSASTRFQKALDLQIETVDECLASLETSQANFDSIYTSLETCQAMTIHAQERWQYWMTNSMSCSEGEK